MADVTVSLTSDEALVLFELLHRWEDAGAIDPVLFAGEQTALWHLSCALEEILVEPFKADYVDRVNQSRQRLFEAGGA